MKSVLLSLLFTAFTGTALAQVDVDKSINLTNTNPGDARVSGIKQVSAAQDAVSAEALQSGRLIYPGSLSGTNDISIVFSPPFTGSALVPGTVINFKALGANTGNVRINVDGLGLKPLYKDVSSNLAAGDIQAGQMVAAMYDGTNFQLVSRTLINNTGGTVTNIGTTAPLTGGPITTGGTIGLTQTGDILQGTGITVTGGADKLPGTADVTIANSGVLSVGASAPLNSSGGQTPSISLTGVVPIANGGTGISTAPTGAGQFLRSSGSGTWATSPIQAGDVPGGSNNYVQNTNTAQSANFNITGSGTIAGNLNLGNNWYFNGANWPGQGGFIYTGNAVTFGIGSTGGQASLMIDGGFRQAEAGTTNYFLDNVGIGTTTPAFRLDVNGSVRLGGFTANNADEWPNVVWYRDPGAGWDEGLIKGNSSRGAWGRTGFGIHMDGSKHFGFFSSGWNTLFDIEGGTGRAYIQGNTGIGTTNPAYKLDVNGGLRAYAYYWNTGVNWYMVDNNGEYSFDFANSDGNSFWSVWSPSNGSILTVRNNGRVGVNNASPGYPLHVSGALGTTLTYSWLAYNNNSHGPCNNCAASYSIRADDRIMCSELNVFSDERIKTIVERSNGSNDLTALRQLQVTDYNYIDKVTKGYGLKKGFIAQEVEKVFPEAISQITDFIPSTFALSTQVCYDATSKTLQIVTTKPHALAAGDKVKLIVADGNLTATVSNLLNEHEFTVSGIDKAYDTVFVYGKEVTDFKIVDYDRLYTLGISATQELDRKVAALEKSNAELKSENRQLKSILSAKAGSSELDKLKAEVEDLKLLMQRNGIRTDNSR